ncbi:hypothetical protein [Azospirillum argentinense]
MRGLRPAGGRPRRSHFFPDLWQDCKIAAKCLIPAGFRIPWGLCAATAAAAHPNSALLICCDEAHHPSLEGVDRAERPCVNIRRHDDGCRRWSQAWKCVVKK